MTGSVDVKTVEKNFRQYGARRDHRDKHGTGWLFPDGAEKLVPHAMSHATAISMLRWVQDRYGTLRGSVINAERVRGVRPVINLEKCTASAHARERLALMRDQQGVTFQEVLMALRAPASVKYSDDHKSWVWVGDRVAVAAHVDETGHATIATVLWTTSELWDASPRPEKASTR